MQKALHVLYRLIDKAVGGKDVRNGRKLSITLFTLVMFFICAMFFPNTKDFLTDAIYVGGIVSVIGLYIGGNVSAKFAVAKAKQTECKYPNVPCEECPISDTCNLKNAKGNVG